jgi:Cu-Zn family superoxide dismutase
MGISKEIAETQMSTATPSTGTGSEEWLSLHDWLAQTLGVRREGHASTGGVMNAIANQGGSRQFGLRRLGLLGAIAIVTASLSSPAAAQTTPSGKAQLRDKDGKEVGSVDLSQTPNGVLLRLSLKGLPAGERAFHIHAAGKCEPPAFDSAAGHFNPGSEKHGILVGRGHAGDMPNLHVPAGGELVIEVVNAGVTLEKGKPNSLFGPAGTAIVIHQGKDDYRTDPTGNAGGRIACGVISEQAPAGGTPPARPK